MTTPATMATHLLGSTDLPPRVLMIDGRSGSGKTTLAEALATRLDAAVLHMDDLYHGWDGLTHAPTRLTNVLQTGEYQRYDWERETLTEAVTLDPHRPLVIEGCGSLTADTLTAARDFAARGGDRSPTSVRTIWLDCPEPLRKARALARDGDIFRPHWDTWAAQEEELLTREHSRDLADVRINSGALTPRPA